MPDITVREAISQALREAILEDERIVIMGEDVGYYGGAYAVTKGLIHEFGDKRIVDTPISESAIVGAAIGAAMGGMRPIVELMTINFSLLAMDQIVNNAAKILYMSGGQMSVPLVIRTVTGGGRQLGAQHSQSLEGWYAHVPGLKVVAPATPYDAKGLLRSALKDHNTILFAEHATLYGARGPVPDEYYDIPLGKADVKRAGTDITLIGYSRGTVLALRAAEMLNREGIQAEVVDLRTLRPLDSDTVVESVMKTSRALVIEDAWKSGGFGAEVVSRIQEEAFDYLDAPVRRLAGAEVPAPYNRQLEQASLPSETDVVRIVREMLKKKPS